MTKNNWVWYAVLGIFYLGLGWITIQFHFRVSEIESLHIDEALESEFRGNDWVSWKSTEKGVVADRVHPLPTYKPNAYKFIQEGDRLLRLDYNEILQPEVVDRITAATPPGYPFIAIIQPEDPYSPNPEEVRTFLSNGFYLTFTFNEYPLYWISTVWLVGIGAFISLVMLAILFPLIRGNWTENISLMGAVGGALLFFTLRLLRHLYLIIESDLESTGFEKVYILIYSVLLFTYILSFFYYKARLPSIWYFLPSLASGVFILARIFQIIFISRHLKYFHEVIEDYTAWFFLLHLFGGLMVFLSQKWFTQRKRKAAPLLLVSLLSLVGIAYFGIAQFQGFVHREHVLFAYNLLLFFPFVNAALLQLQFGKVSLVVTRTFQYLVLALLSIMLYLVIIQVFNYLPGIQYRRILEFIAFIILVLVFYMIYRSNQNRVSKYFVTAQQERLNNLKSFIAQIPQYTSSHNLRKDLVEKLLEFFNAETIHLWWSADQPNSEAEKRYYTQQQKIYDHLSESRTVWSKSKEIAAFRLPQDMEKEVLQSPYTLICPITVDEDRHALLLLGRKRRGVYNLSDLELIYQLIQQTQLTLNVLQLYAREKDLIQQTYEANLTALRSQINPHFLFNTLNSIGELVHESADLAEQAVEKLAFIFRYTLKKSSQNFVPLSDEMQLISTYLDLEKIRFGDRLNVHIEVAKEIKDTQIPAFILMTLTENCIKHGIAKILSNGQVSIDCFREDDHLVCEVYDNGPGIDLSRIYKSTGLSNSIARLENIYDQKNLLYFENTGDGTLVRMKIPLKTG
jgi:hypothetical protein